MGLFFQVLASGSKGNITYVQTPNTGILIDAGLSARATCRLLQASSRGVGSLDGLLLSHEHSDHSYGVGVISRRLDLPVYATPGTWIRLRATSRLGALAGRRSITPGESFTIGDLQVTPFPVPHDGAQPVGFVLEHDGQRLGICTDLGEATSLVREYLQGCHALILESNHDLDCLINCSYPDFVIDRIKSPLGHLDNGRAVDLLRDLYHPDMGCVVLAHLSETNNSPELVSECFGQLRDLPEWETVRFEVATQFGGAPGIEVGGPFGA